MKPTTIYLPAETEERLQKLALEIGITIPELIQTVISDYCNQPARKLPKSVGIGASGRSDLSIKIGNYTLNDFNEETKQTIKNIEEQKNLAFCQDKDELYKELGI